jgi:hypothetical protein
MTVTWFFLASPPKQSDKTPNHKRQRIEKTPQKTAQPSYGWEFTILAPESPVCLSAITHEVL